MLLSNKVDYNVLYRPIKSGKDYDSLLPKSFCKSTRLSSGNTDTTVNHMIDWVKTHQQQTVKLSTVLQKRTLAQTVDSIYQFLYHHIQYKADATDQLLHSPACSWYKRKEGIDCKSFSIFASSILTNLAIPHIIRKVKQPYHFPSQYTHVYIIVPKNGKDLSKGYYVIDATKHQNTEVLFTEKKDVFMSLPHYGLNGAHDNRSVSAPMVSNKALEGLENYLTLLKRVGVRKEIINGIQSEVYKYLRSGINPKFKIYRQGVIVQYKRFLFENNLGGLNRSGSSLGSARSAILELSGNYNGLGNPDQATTDTNQDSGQELEEVTQIVLDSNWFEDTFGAIFANGFDFSCWGSSYNPSQGRKDVEKDMPFFLQFSGLDREVNTTNYNRFQNAILAYRSDAAFHQQSRYAKCTREGHRVRMEAVDRFVESINQTVRQSYNLTPLIDKEGALEMPQGFPGYYAGRLWRVGRIHNYAAFKYKYMTVSPKSGTTGGGINVGGNTGGNNGNSGNGSNDSGGNNTPDIANPINPTIPINPSNNTSNASFGIAGILLVGGLLFNKQIKNAFTKNKK